MLSDSYGVRVICILFLDFARFVMLFTNIRLLDPYLKYKLRQGTATLAARE